MPWKSTRPFGCLFSSTATLVGRQFRSLGSIAKRLPSYACSHCRRAIPTPSRSRNGSWDQLLLVIDAIPEADLYRLQFVRYRSEAYAALRPRWSGALESVRGFIWHGNVGRALGLIEDPGAALEPPPPSQEVPALPRRVQWLCHEQRRADPELCRAPPLRRGGLDCVRRVHRQSGGRQALRQDAAEAVDAARCPLPHAFAHPRPRRHAR